MAQPTLGRNDAIQWNAIVAIVSVMRIVGFARGCEMAAEAEPAKRVRGKRPPEGEPVIDRALALFAAFDAGHRRLTLRELSRRSGIPVSSTLRMAGRLLAWGALERDEEGRYSIGLRLLEVASLAPRGHGLRQVALPYMSDLAAVTKQHVQLAVREGLEVTLVERFSSHSAIPVLYRVGGKMPLHCTGMGLALLAFAPVEVQEEVLSLPLHGEPDQNLIPPAVMRRTLAEVRHERVAIYRRMDVEPAGGRRRPDLRRARGGGRRARRAPPRADSPAETAGLRAPHRRAEHLP